MNRNQQRMHAAFTLVATVIIAIFAVWWFSPSHIANNFTGWYHGWDIFLFLVVTYIIWHPIVMEVLVWAISSHIKIRNTPKPKEGMKVAFLTTFVPGSETIDLLEKTLPAMINVSYPHDTWVLDEGNDPAVKELCQRLGAMHFSRHGKDHYNTPHGKYARKTKGGNHNSWHDMHGKDYEFVAQMDTDFIPHKDFLLRTLGYFNDPKVAFVGTPQIYGNDDKSIIAKGASEQTYTFYGPILRGLDGMDATNLIGANHVMRVAALEDVDHYSAHITEDLLTGMKLHANRWKSIYVPEALAIGEGPSTWKAYFSQQKRWAYGCMHILFTYSPGLFKKMHIRQTIYYLLMQQHYFSGVAMMFSLILLAVYFVLGYTSSNIQLTLFLALYIPVILALVLMQFWLQRFNIRPKKERGILWAGAYINIAAWPIFLMAFFSLFQRKKLVYKVTPKGVKTHKTPRFNVKLFAPHLIIAILAAGLLASSYFTGRQDPLMVFWATITTFTLVIVPILVPLYIVMSRFVKFLSKSAKRINSQYRILEFNTPDKGLLPSAPSDTEKYKYAKRYSKFLMFFSIISFVGVNLSMLKFLAQNPMLWSLFAFLTLTIVYFIISLVVNLFTKDFDLNSHKKIVSNWQPDDYPSVDVFLPTAGEPLDVLRNTWTGVEKMVRHYKGRVTVYSLDDADSTEVKALANEFGFTYIVREDRGYFKKAGNLRNGYRSSNSEFIAIFDADFVPRSDFLNETLPYFDQINMGIVQSPQYFDVAHSQNWLERGAGAVQELFYRFSQVSRQHHDASICVGSNAVYRRAALNSTGGTALIEHSEDVHTGFNLRIHGWTIQYIPIILAKGLCPSSMTAFFKQQYRWCMGSLSLLTSKKFWSAKLRLRTRLSYMSGFMYYIHTGLSSFYAPIVPVLLLVLLPHQISLINYILLLPAFIFTQLIYPIWHQSVYGVEAWSTRQVYGWAHMFAIWDKLTNKSMGWVPTGSRGHKDHRYTIFRVFQIMFNFVPAILWVVVAGYYTITESLLVYLPIFISGVYFLIVSSKVTFYTYKKWEIDSSGILGKAASSSGSSAAAR